MNTEVVTTKERWDGDVQFSVSWVDGIGLLPFNGLLLDGPVTRLQKIRDLETRDDDIILANYPKSGTHWIWEIINMLLTGKAEYKKENKANLMLESLLDLCDLDKEKSPRVINTHVPIRWLPKRHIENGRKIVHVIRNPKDVSVSFYSHLKSSGEAGHGTTKMTWSQFLDNVVLGEVTLYDGWFAYEREMYIAKKNGANIYTLQYERLKLTPHNEIKELAKFLGVSYTDRLVEEIIEACSFNKLKDVEKVLPTGHVTDINTMQERLGRAKIRKPIIYRKGVVGDWKNFFTVAQNKRFDARYKEEMKGINLDLIYDSITDEEALGKQ